MNLKKRFRKWKKKNNPNCEVMLKLEQGDDNLIVELCRRKGLNKPEYYVSIYEYEERFKPLEIKRMPDKPTAEKHFKKIVDEF